MTAQVANGGLHDLIRRGGIGAVWCDGREVLRRIFVTVRDKNWSEVPPSQWDCEVDEALGSATLRATHLSDLVAFEWHGRLQVSKDRRHLRFRINGQVMRDMEVCRLGLVLLHPVTAMVDSQISVVGPHAANRFVIARTIAPQPVVNGIPQAMTDPIRAMEIERADFGRLELTFDGDLFELEDQRNWGDASFKTYCTPLRLGFPRAYQTGTSISHSVDVRFTPPDKNLALDVQMIRSGKWTTFYPITRGITSDPDHRFESIRGVFPKLGREWRAPGQAKSGFAGQPALWWQHFHVTAADLASSATVSEVLGGSTSTQLEIAIEAEESASPELLELVFRHRERTSRILLYGSKTTLPSIDAIQRWRRDLSTSAAVTDVPVMVGTRGYFVELNRGIRIDATASGVLFPLTATVHGDDAELIIANVPTIRDMADTVRGLTGLTQVAIAPLALYHPTAASPRFPSELVLPWLTATLIQAALAGVGSVTLSVDVLEALDVGGMSFLSSLIECAGAEVLGMRGKLPPQVHAMIVRSTSSGCEHILACNLGAESVSCVLSSQGLFVDGVLDARSEDTDRPHSRRIELQPFSTLWIEKE